MGLQFAERVRVPEPAIVASAKEPRRFGAGEAEDTRRAWLLLGWVGLVFLIVGGTDFALVWIPSDFGSREWEFGTVTQGFNGLPIVLLGVGLLSAASTRTDRRWWGLVASLAALVLLVWVLVGFGLWANSVNLALTTVPEQLQTGVRKAAVKTLIQSLAYPAVLVYMLGRAWMARRTTSR